MLALCSCFGPHFADCQPQAMRSVTKFSSRPQPDIQTQSRIQPIAGIPAHRRHTEAIFMPFCPNCSSTVAPASSSCEGCGAEFGPGSSWAPTDMPPKQKRTRQETQRTPTEILFARLGGTIWLLVAIAWSGWYLLALGVLSLPIGLRNSPLGAATILPLLHVLSALFALVQLWMTKPYTTLFLIVATLPLVSWIVFPISAVLFMR